MVPNLNNARPARAPENVKAAAKTNEQTTEVARASAAGCFESTPVSVDPSKAGDPPARPVLPQRQRDERSSASAGARGVPEMPAEVWQSIARLVPLNDHEAVREASRVFRSFYGPARDWREVLAAAVDMFANASPGEPHTTAKATGLLNTILAVVPQDLAIEACNLASPQVAKKLQTAWDKALVEAVKAPHWDPTMRRAEHSAVAPYVRPHTLLARVLLPHQVDAEFAKIVATLQDNSPPQEERKLSHRRAMEALSALAPRLNRAQAMDALKLWLANETCVGRGPQGIAMRLAQSNDDADFVDAALSHFFELQEPRYEDVGGKRYFPVREKYENNVCDLLEIIVKFAAGAASDVRNVLPMSHLLAFARKKGHLTARVLSVVGPLLTGDAELSAAMKAILFNYCGTNSTALRDSDQDDNIGEAWLAEADLPLGDAQSLLTLLEVMSVLWPKITALPLRPARTLDDGWWRRVDLPPQEVATLVVNKALGGAIRLLEEMPRHSEFPMEVAPHACLPKLLTSFRAFSRLLGQQPVVDTLRASQAGTANRYHNVQISWLIGHLTEHTGDRDGVLDAAGALALQALIRSELPPDWSDRHTIKALVEARLAPVATPSQAAEALGQFLGSFTDGWDFLPACVGLVPRLDSKDFEALYAVALPAQRLAMFAHAPDGVGAPKFTHEQLVEIDGLIDHLDHLRQLIVEDATNRIPASHDERDAIWAEVAQRAVQRRVRMLALAELSAPGEGLPRVW